MTMKHTPGPWSSYPCNLEAYSRVITANGAMVQIAHTGVREKIAMTKEVYGDRITYEPGEETTANARLIVAAPELLDELIEQDKFLGVLAGTVPLSEKDTHRRIAMHRESVRAAISKATGSV